MSDAVTYYCAECDCELELPSSFIFQSGQTVKCKELDCGTVNTYDEDEDDFYVILALFDEDAAYDADEDDDD